MKKRSRVAFVVLAVLVAVAGVTSVIVRLGTDASLEFRLKDAISGRWVWDATIRSQDREIRSFYQADSGDFAFRLTKLRPGASSLELAAPGYQPQSLPLRLKRGRNVLPETIKLVGLEIPDLRGFFVFEHLEVGDIVGELRPVGGNGMAVLNHPCMDLWVGCVVSVQLSKGSPAIEEMETGATRGRELFRGEVTWKWDPSPETQFRYSARIPAASIAEDPSDYRVVDYLIVVPKPLAITRAELGGLMAKVHSLGDPESMKAALDAEKDRLSWYLDMSANVKARQE